MGTHFTVNTVWVRIISQSIIEDAAHRRTHGARPTAFSCF
jgi:hypothetical protein